MPLKIWGLDELTLCALYFHSKLDIAKAQLGLANAAIETATIRENPILNGSIARSNLANDDKRPWAYGLNVEIPIVTSNKREIKIEEAQKLAEVARMDVADTAWQLRSQLANNLIEYHQNSAQIQLLQNELAIQNEIIGMLQKRLDSGLASSTELNTAQLLTLKTQSLLHYERAKTTEISAKLASGLGLTPQKFEQLSIKPLNMEDALEQQSALLDKPLQSKTLQEKALLNRIDIRRSIAKYAAAEAKIKLEVAKQTPDISLNPGFIFEFGDKIWSLGFSSLINLLNKNSALIHEAKQLRAIEGAQFEHLQAQIIAELSQVYVRYETARQTLNQAKLQATTQSKLMQKMQKQFDAGLTDRLALKQTSLSNIVAEQQVIAAQFNLLNIANEIEDVLQTPLYSNFAMP
ncbi:MAG: TolC family protein [Methylophilaceae bacterium]